jgi:hypothetical protein
VVEWELALTPYRGVLDLRDKAVADAIDHDRSAPPPQLPAFLRTHLENRPDLDEGDLFFVRAYRDLATCRPEGFNGPGLIPWTAIQLWIDRHGAAEDPILADAIHVIIRAMDTAERAWHVAHPPPPKAPQKPPPRGRRG